MLSKRLFHRVLLFLILATSLAARPFFVFAGANRPDSIKPVQQAVTNGPNLKFNVSVGLDPLSCASQDSLTVSPGTKVYYCYSAENTGDVALVRHTLVDSSLGTLLNNFGYDLLPTATVFITASATINGPVTNNASWTSFTAGNIPVNEMDSATVTIANAGLSLNKTVGTDPNACATTDSITVPAGSKVTYCYKATNTGSENLVTHSLVDDHLGTLLTNLGYVLSPGASAFITQTATINAATINSATWTGRTTGNVPASATDTASVSISAGSNASLAFNKTVGTDANACATTDSITVAAGTRVTYCYSVTNTGSQALTSHDLLDDKLGALLTNFSYNLLPSASAFITQSVTVDSSVMNTAAWTARTAGGATASEADSALVTVTGGQKFKLYLPLIFKR